MRPNGAPASSGGPSGDRRGGQSFSLPAPAMRETAELGPGLIESLWRYRGTVVAVTLAVAVLAGGLSLLVPERYEATSRLFLAERGSAGVFDVAPTNVDPARYAENQAQLLMSRPVMQRAAGLIDERLTAGQIRDRVEAETSPDFDLITIRALDESAARAAELANTVAEAYEDTVEEEVRTAAEQAITRLEETAVALQEQIRAIEERLGDGSSAALAAERDGALAQLAGVERRISQLSIDAGLFGSGVRLLEQAEVPAAPVQPRPLRNTGLGLVLGALAASAFAYWRAGHTRRADHRHDPAALLQAPLLGEVPDFASIGASAPVPAHDTPQSVAVEAYELIAASLDFTLDDGDGGSVCVLVTSPQAGDGKTTTALNLALAARRDTRSVVLVDADERARGLSSMAGLAEAEGITDLGEFAVPSRWCQSTWDIGKELSTRVIPAGTRTDVPGSFFRTSGSRTAMKRVRAQADMVVVDAPPLLDVAETSAIASHVDGIILVVRRGTPQRLLEECRERLAFIGTPLLGYVFNRASPARGRYGAYRYGYGSDNGKGRKVARERQPSTS